MSLFTVQRNNGLSHIVDQCSPVDLFRIAYNPFGVEGTCLTTSEKIGAYRASQSLVFACMVEGVSSYFKLPEFASVRLRP